MKYAIETQGIWYRPGKSFEIQDVALHVPAGGLYGFLGPNGSGKTTMIRVILGMIRPDRGTATVCGHDTIRETPQMLARVGYVPERPHLHPTFTVAEAIRFHSAFYPRWDAKWAAELAATFQLPKDSVISRLSKGESGKLLMLLALSQRPEVLVLDEPTDGLDPVVRRDVLTAVLDYVSENKATVFISSHLIHEVERFCDWIGVMDRGKLVAELPMELFKNGLKRLRVANAPTALPQMPFRLLSRSAKEGVAESWLVQGWEPGMREFFENSPLTLREVIDLDLEEGFVELLRTFRQTAA